MIYMELHGPDTAGVSLKPNQSVESDAPEILRLYLSYEVNRILLTMFRYPPDNKLNTRSPLIWRTDTVS